MKIKLYLTFVLCIYLLFTICNQAHSNQQTKHISVAVLTVNEQQIALFSEQFNRFNLSQSKIWVDVDFYSDQGLKSKLSSWLESGKYDLIHWQAGKRLTDIVNQELLIPIDDLIDKQILKENINPQLLQVVDLKGSYQALPFAYYPWGFYYSKELFAEYDISPPQTWAEFLAICRQLKKQGVAPLVQANQEGWPLLAWLDFLALDNGGVSTRHNLTQFAAVSSSSGAKIVEQFSTLLEHGYFFAPDHSWRWEQTITLLVKQQAAMTLIGQFAESQIQPQHSAKIGYFPFPHRQVEGPHPAVAPIDLFVVPLASENHAYLSSLLNFLVQAKTNKILATGLGFLPAYPQFDGEGLSERALIGLQSLRESSELVQFFDRDAQNQYANNLANSIATSILNGESSALERAVLGQEFIQSTEQRVKFGLPEKLLNFSSFTGSRGTFFASNILNEVYQKLGFNISVTRYQSLSESLNSYKFGADGELVRAALLNTQTDDLIQVPEPIADTAIYLVCRSSDACARKLPSDATIGNSMDILALKGWWEREQVLKQDYATTTLMMQAYAAGQLNYMILSAIDVSANAQQLTNNGFRTILRIPFYHFIHKKHKGMLDAVDQGIKDFKQTSAYQDFKKRYWLN